jgi:starch-binding outer membrane protein, SusD/RagB family
MGRWLTDRPIRRLFKKILEIINYMNSKYNFATTSSRLCLLLVISLISCKKLVEISAPVTSVNGANVYVNDVTASAVLTGLYTNMSKAGSNFTGNGSISLYLGLSADEFTLSNRVSTSDANYYYYTNSLFALPTGGAGSNFWDPLYQNIFICNSAIEGLNGANLLTPSVKQQLLGEAIFMRAFFYFYLVNIFGDIPLLTTTDYKVNSVASRTSKDKVYQQIIADLKAAQDLLSDHYVDASVINMTSERTRPSKWAATALLARVFLYIGDWSNAIAEASSIISNTSLFKLTSLSDAFLKNSQEAIWQLQPVNSQRNTEDAWVFMIPSSGPDASNYPVYLSRSMLQSFEIGDQRAKLGNWVDSTIYKINSTTNDTVYFPYKYKSAISNATLTEYLMVFRVAEQYLIRAEAEAQQNNIGVAQSFLNAVRNRSGLSNIAVAEKSSLLTAILHERQVEFFTEWGHRWLDLKRTNNIDPVMTTVTPLKANGMPWKSYQQFYPIPFGDILTDPNLTQNPGY